MQKLFDEFSTTANSRGVDLRIVRSSLTVRSDAVLLEQMLRNLLSNALKYAPGGRVLIGCRKHRDQVQIKVLDTGIGIPAAEMGAIFDEYFQISANAPGMGQGMGLGLNIVQRLGVILGHEVSARSELGKGSSFSISVPLGQAPVMPAHAEHGEAPHTCLRHGHILVVEDDLQVGSLLQILLTGEGHRVTLVETSQAALTAVAGGLRPDMLLTDYNLPGGMDGLALIFELRRRGPMPAIVLSGDITAESLRRIASEDVLHLAKPVTVGRLAVAVASLLKRHALVPVHKVQTATVHIVDDDETFRAALRMMLEAEGHNVADHATCEAFLAGFEPTMPGCLLLDAYLPGMDGLSLMAQLRHMGSKMPVIMITGQSDVEVAVSAMKAGAADFLEKPVSGAQIQASILRAMAHSGPVAPVALTNLTPRQSEVLQGVMAGQASKVIAYELNISQRTVESHRAAIMARVGAKSVPELVRKVLGVA